MNILFDGPYTPHPKAGVVRYFSEISTTISLKNKVSFSRYSKKPQIRYISLPPFPHFRPHKLSFFLEFLWHKFLGQKMVDIVHPIEFQISPSGTHYINKGAKLIITIHDLIHEKFGAPGNLHDPEQRYDFYSKANGFIFVSHSTKNDFSKHYPSLFESKPSQVIWHGCNFDIQKYPATKKKQFIFVGSREGYKNFPNACLAFEKTLKRQPECYLAIVGSPPSSKELIMVEKFKSQIIWVNYPSQKTLKEFYAESLGLLYVSTYEGFGMPLLEAMSQGCVPIAGIHSSIPEVLGDAGIMVNVEDSAEISGAMLKCLNKPQFLDQLVQKGLMHSQNFTWNRAAEETLSFYKSL